MKSSGLIADFFKYRFSTKPIDEVSEFYYYGYRYYDATTGRWPSRDPINERGGVNLYGFVGNGAINWVDILGLCELIVYGQGGPNGEQFRLAAETRYRNALKRKKLLQISAHSVEYTQFEIPDEFKCACYLLEPKIVYTETGKEFVDAVKEYANEIKLQHPIEDKGIPFVSIIAHGFRNGTGIAFWMQKGSRSFYRSGTGITYGSGGAQTSDLNPVWFAENGGIRIQGCQTAKRINMNISKNISSHLSKRNVWVSGVNGSCEFSFYHDRPSNWAKIKATPASFKGDYYAIPNSGEWKNYRNGRFRGATEIGQEPW